ncbi:MAG TPA: S1 RNA-binding domain-containing protein [Aequorivita sp.]|nr:S1 RNA-binding domain-containing protein [Aequorivita sp.]
MNILISLITGLGIGALITFYAITHWNNIKLFFSDLFRLFGFLGKWVRKKSVEQKYEAIINSAIEEFNSNFENKILPGCKVNWISNESNASYLDDDKAIVCLRFNKKDEDLNFFNATYSYTRTGLLPKTRHYVRPSSQKSIDLNLTKIILKNYQRRSLRIFNEKYKNENDEVKEGFEKLEETEKRGLFRVLLIPELYYLGETLDTITPNKQIEEEIENFIKWFYDLATREKDENSNLNYQSTNLKVGVILVANLETYNNYGTEAYTKWAEKYASENYGAVYLLARGANRSKILKEVVDELVDSKGFDQINKKVSSFQVDETGEQVEIFCYCLKPNNSKLQYHAWEKIRKKFNEGKLVDGIVKIIEGDKIVVNVYGREVEVPQEKLSSQEISNVYKYFHKEQELLLNIEQFDYEKGTIVLNNIDTDTDPKLFIDNTLEEKRTFKVIVDFIQVDAEGREQGIRTYCPEIKKKVFVPKSKCSYSRFINLESEFQKREELTVFLHGFSYQFGNFIGEIEGLENPWLKIDQYSEESVYKATIQEVNKSYITTEFILGLECRVYRNELSWEGKLNPEDFDVGDEIEIIIIKIDHDQYRIYGSLKRVNKSNNQIFWEENGNSIIEGKVTKIIKGIGLTFNAQKYKISGFVHISELIWGFCTDIESIFPAGSKINVRGISYDFHKNQIEFSIRECYQNDFQDFQRESELNDMFNGRVVKHIGDICRVEIGYKDKKVQGYIHKSEISNYSFVTSGDLPIYLPVGAEFSFSSKRLNKKNKVVELSRRKYLNDKMHLLDYGDSIEMIVVKKESDSAFVYGNNAEGKIISDYEELEIGRAVKAYPINKNGEFQV